MIQEDKELLLKDLCARLPYGTLCDRLGKSHKLLSIVPDKSYCLELYNGEYASSFFTIDDVKPYLRPMSSMTEEEKEELLNLLFDKESKNFYIDEEGFIDGKTSDLMKDGLSYPCFCPINIVLYTDWLNAHHFDYRGLIEKGLAIEAPEGIYEL